MTYYELFTKAEYLLSKNKITLGEYHKMVQPLNEEVREEGRWIFDEKGYFFCSECKVKPNSQYATTDYCPNCGARMKGE